MKAYVIKMSDERVIDVIIAKSLSDDLEAEFLAVDGVRQATGQDRGCDMDFYIYLSERLDSREILGIRSEIETICKRREQEGE